MANRTDPLARSIHGTNPQNLVEKILRMKIYNSTYWKERCFGLTAETLVDEAVSLKYIGGTFGGARKPTDFMCLVLKLLQIQPDREIVVEFIKNEDYKYVRLLGAFYLRLVGRPLEVYQYLEPLYNDYRKLRLRDAEGNFVLSHMDELVEQLLKDDYLFDVALPRIPIRLTLEQTGQLDKWVSAIEGEFDEMAIEAEADKAAAEAARVEADLKREAAAEAEREAAVEAARARERQARHRSRSPEHHRHERDERREMRRERDERHRDQERYERDVERERRRDKDRGRERGREHGRSQREGDRKRRRSRSREQLPGPPSRKRDGDGLSVAETNKLRESLGMKPLKP